VLVYYLNRHYRYMTFLITWTAAGLFSLSFWTAVAVTLARLLK